MPTSCPPADGSTSDASLWSYMADPIDQRYAAYKRPLLKQVGSVGFRRDYSLHGADSVRPSLDRSLA